MMILDEAVPNGAFDDEETEFLWDHCIREYPNDPWSAFSALSATNTPPRVAVGLRGHGRGLAGDSGGES